MSIPLPCLPLLLVLVIWLPQPSRLHAQVNAPLYEISPRVGPEIDPAERAYFNLFRNVEGFESARAYRRTDDSIRIVITYREREAEQQRSTLDVVISQASALELAAYVEHFEAGSRIASEIDFRLLSGLATFRYRYRPRPMTAYLVDGSTVTGILLHASDDVLVFWTGPGDFHWRTAEAHLLVLHHAHVGRLAVPRSPFRKFVGWLGQALLGGGFAYLDAQDGTHATTAAGAGIGVLNGTLVQAHAADQIFVPADPAAYRRARPRLGRIQAFRTATPPELDRQLARLPEIARDAAASERADLFRTARPRYQLSLSPAFHTGYEDFDGFVATGFGRPASNAQVGAATLLELSAAYALRPRLSAGVEVRVMPRPPFQDATEHLYGTTLGAFAEYALKPPDPVFFSSRTAFSLGGGLHATWQYTAHRLHFTPQVISLVPELAEAPRHSTTSQRRLGAHLRAAFDYYATPWMSLRLKATYSLPRIEVPVREYTYERGTVYRFEAYHLPALLVSLGYRWHL